MLKKTLAVTVFVFFCLALVLAQSHSVFAQGMTDFEEVTNANFDQVNPLNPAIGGGDAANQTQLSTPGGIFSRVLEYAFPLAGLILFVMLLWGGFEMIFKASSSKSIEAGRQRATAAIVGFILLFISYWLIQIVTTLFGIQFL